MFFMVLSSTLFIRIPKPIDRKHLRERALVGFADPRIHDFAIERHVQRAVKTVVLAPEDLLAVDIPDQLLLGPAEPVDMKIR
jgi:hypothetical protein